MLRLALVLLVLASVPLRANLGETVADCVKRYGHPVGYSEASPKFPFGTIVFAAGNYTLVVFLHDTKEVGARVTKKDKSAFTDDELKTILAADSLGAGWTGSAGGDPSSTSWTRVDKATAIYDHAAHVLIFTSPTMADLMQAAASTPPAPGPSTNAAPSPSASPANALPPAPAGAPGTP